MKSDDLTPPLKTLQRLLPVSSKKKPKYQEEPTKPRSPAVQSSGESHSHVLSMTGIPKVCNAPLLTVCLPSLAPSHWPSHFHCLADATPASLANLLFLEHTKHTSAYGLHSLFLVPDVQTTLVQVSWNKGHGHLVCLLSKHSYIIGKYTSMSVPHHLTSTVF